MPHHPRPLSLRKAASPVRNLGPRKRDDAYANSVSAASKGERLLSNLETGLREVGGLVPIVGQSYKKECQEKNLPHRLNTAPFLSRHSAHCLSVVFLRAESLVSSPRAKRRYASSPCGVLFPVVTAPIVLKQQA